MRSDEDFIEILIRRVKATISGTRNSQNATDGSESVTGNSLGKSTIWPMESQSSVMFTPQTDTVPPVFGSSQNSVSLNANNGDINGKTNTEESFKNIDDIDGKGDDRPSLTSMKTILL